MRNTLRVLCFIEAKKHASVPSEILEAERQAVDACRRHMTIHDQHNLYVLTVDGTRAKPWTFEKNDDYMLPMDASISPFETDVRTGYIEMNSPDGHQLTAAFERMMRLPPARLAGNVLSWRDSESHDSRYPYPHSLRPAQAGVAGQGHPTQELVTIPTTVSAAQFRRPSRWDNDWKEVQSRSHPTKSDVRSFNVDGN